MREAFRPFAPAVTLREVSKWFDVSAGAEFPYMITTVDVRREHRNRLPAVTHVEDRKSTRLNSSHVSISYAVFCLKKKKNAAPASRPTLPNSSRGRQPTRVFSSAVSGMRTLVASSHVDRGRAARPLHSSMSN